MYTEKQENDLIHCAQKGDKQACSQVLAAYEGLIQNMSRRYQYTPTGKTMMDDARSILNMAFMEALRDFHSERGVHFAAFLQSRLHGAIYKAFKHRYHEQEHTAHPAPPEDEENCTWYDNIASKLPTPEHITAARDTLNQLCQLLSDAEKRLLSLRYLAGLSQKEIARRLHTSPAAICRQLKGIKAKLQAIDDMDAGCPCT